MTMAQPVKLILSLDPLPGSVITGRERRTYRPLLGSGSSSRPSARKRRCSPARFSRYSATENKETSEDEQSDDADDVPAKAPSKIEGQPKKRFKAEKPAKPKYVQIVGIDPGMSGSGMSLASIKTDPSIIAAEMLWPGSAQRSEKIPSVVAVIEDNPDHDEFGNGEDRSFFGFEVPANSASRSYYKISLDVNPRPSNFDDPILNSALASKLVQAETPERNREAIVISLSHLKKIHVNKARTRLGHGFDDTSFKYVIAYPAACSARGIQALREAVRQAGFDDHEPNRPEFISEAHAAAMAGFTTCRSEQGSEAWKKYFQRGTLVTVIDVGALTVDLTTVRIESNDPSLSLSEATIPSGGRCGTAAIHCRLMQKLAEKFGDAFTDLDRKDLECGSQFFRNCEEHLKLFHDSKRNKKFRVNLELAEPFQHPDYNVDTEEVTVQGSEIKSAIDANLEYAKRLLSEQWQQPKKYRGNSFRQESVSTTMLCGGGSLIPYVHANLQEFCRQAGIQFVHAKDPESTVCRGAVISQLRPDLYGNRLSRASFGIEVTKNSHQYIEWFLNQGDDLDTSKETALKTVAGYVYITYQQILDITQSFELPVLMYNAGGDNPDSTHDQRVEQVSTITIASSALSDYMRRKLSRQMREESTHNTPLAVAVSIKVDRSGRLFFEAKHNTAFFGRGELRLDDTVQRG